MDPQATPAVKPSHAGALPPLVRLRGPAPPPEAAMPGSPVAAATTTTGEALLAVPEGGSSTRQPGTPKSRQELHDIGFQSPGGLDLVVRAMRPGPLGGAAAASPMQPSSPSSPTSPASPMSPSGRRRSRGYKRTESLSVMTVKQARRDAGILVPLLHYYNYKPGLAAFGG